MMYKPKNHRPKEDQPFSPRAQLVCTPCGTLWPCRPVEDQRRVMDVLEESPTSLAALQIFLLLEKRIPRERVDAAIAELVSDDAITVRREGRFLPHYEMKESV